MRMKKFFLMIVGMVMALSVQAQGKFALAEGDTYKSADQVTDVPNITLTFGEAGGNDFKAASAAGSVEGYTAFTEGNGTNGNKAGGTFYTLAPEKDGKIAVAVVLNSGKKFYIEEDGTALADYNGITVDEKFYGTFAFDVQAGKSYKVYCAGSKLGFFGFEYEVSGFAKSGDLSELIAAYIEANPDLEAYDIVLPAGGAYTVSAPIIISKPLTIIGDATSPATIDASVLTGDNAIIKMAPVEDMTTLEKVVFSNLNMKIATRLFYANKQKYWVKKLYVDNCLIAVDGTFKKSIFDCNGGGNVSHLLVNKSTIYANPKVGQNGGFFSSQSSQKPTEFGADEKQTFEITNSTLYNITNANDMCTLREKDKDYLTFILTDNIIVNCGKNKQFFKGFAGGSDAKKATWIVDKNTIFWGGVDVSKDETIKGTNAEVKNCLTTDPGFADPENGDFTVSMASDQAKYKTGDPRWVMDASEYVILNLPSGSDIGKELEAYNAETPKGVTINLVKDGAYTSSKPIYFSCSIAINGAEGAVIDASANNLPFILMRPLPVADLNEYGAYEISGITIKGVKITGVKNRLFYADRQKYLIDKLAVENSVIHIDGTTPRSIFDFYSGGNFKELSILNSTFYADPSNSQRAGLLSTQSSHSLVELGGNEQKISIKNSTLYNIAKGMLPVLLQRHSLPTLTFEVQNNVIVNSGEKGNFIAGLNEGQKSTEPKWLIGNNTYTFDGEDSGFTEAFGNKIAGPVSFKDAANGDFTLSILTQAFERNIGDPRWLTPAEDELMLALESGKDVGAEVAAATEGKTLNTLLVKLAADGQFTSSKTIEFAGDLVIKGDEEKPATIDGSALETPFLQLATIPAPEEAATGAPRRAANEKGFEVINQVKMLNTKVSGLKYQFFYANKQKYLIKQFTIGNSTIGIDGTNKKTIFDFNGGGLAEELTVNNSTLWANPTNGQNGGFYSTQSGSKIDEAGAEKNVITIDYSTIYNIASGKTTSTLRQNSQAAQKYIVTNSIIAESGKEGQFLAGLNGGQKGKAENFEIGGNNITFGGADVTETEATKINGTINNPVIGAVTFKDAENGDFTLTKMSVQNAARIGDPRWWVAVPEDITIAPAAGDITAALEDALKDKAAKNITINLAEGGKYTITKTIDAPASVTINGNGATIDASALTSPMIQLSNDPSVLPTMKEKEDGTTEVVSYQIDGVKIKDVIISGLKYQLFYANKQLYLLNELMVDNSVIGIDGTNKKTIFDFNGGGNVVALTVQNSTLWANPTNGQNGGFFSSQSGKEVTDLGGETTKTSILNSTLYNITNAKSVSTLRKNSQAYQSYEVKNNIIVDCGKSGQFLKGLNAGQAGKDTNWDVDSNVFNFAGAVSTEQKIGSTEENIKNSIEVVVVFADAEKGDFTQNNAKAGDPRWIGDVPTGIETVKTAEAIDLNNAVIYNLNGQRVEKAQKGLYIVNGRKVVIK